MRRINLAFSVKRCRVRPNFFRDGYRMCHLSSDMRLGTVCHYGCYQGHTLKGAPSVIKCVDADGSQAQWSSDVEPFCESIYIHNVFGNTYFCIIFYTCTRS